MFINPPCELAWKQFQASLQAPVLC